ncbi:uncharacterized protein LOC101854196 [Aplysia californica]|uniref:Uncharacterized protein LOC101854196 n=1 Tax=Aplysia californica TaxID=6500 RepID=A0ABM0K253_APLCA|nr:uncharacterized protein LOC101854196 [Aplysia californica]
MALSMPKPVVKKISSSAASSLARRFAWEASSGTTECSVPVFWMREQRQCAAAFSENTELLNFTFCLDHAIPYWVVALPVLATCFAKIFISRRRSPGTGEIILERNSDAPGDSYSARLTNVQAKFSAKHSKLHPTRERKDAKKGSLGKRVFTPQGYVEPEQWDSDIEDGADVNTDGKPRRQRIYYLECPDYMMLRASAVTIFVTWLLWFPWVVARFVWNFTPYEDVPGWFEVLAVVCMHLSSFAKPVVYTLANPYFRGAVAKTVLCRRDMRLKP